MCGIAGFYGFKNDSLIKKVSKELTHRGPDGEGLFINETVTLLNRRLAIIDLKTGDQPKYSDDKNIVAVFNGEIYNYQDLRDELRKKNYKFHTESDTEVIVKSYQEWGENCFNLFNGMFAIALYDSNKQKLILARDHFGIKPLYYSTVGPKIIFSSEITSLINSGLIKKEPNDRIIYRYLKYRVHDDQEETFFKGVEKLMPGQMLVVDKNGLKAKYFSNLKTELRQSAGTNALTAKEVSEFRNKFIEAVKFRLISDVPVGTCLSGGIDSSVVVTVINQLLREKVKESSSVGKVQQTFSAVFPDYSNNEEKYIDDLIKKIDRVKNFKVRPNAKVFLKELEQFIKIQEEPTISTGPYAQYKVMEEVSKHVKVVLDGQGSDEMLAGYDPYYFVYLRQLVKEKKYLKFLTEFFTSWDIVYKYVQFKTRSLGMKKEVDLEQILNPAFTKKYSKEQFRNINDNLKLRLIDDIFYNSLPSLLRYEDKNSMHFSIEGRVPFLDFNLMKYIFSLPDKAIIKNGWNKSVLRRAFSNSLPSSISKRRNKIGFTTPEQEWFRSLTGEIYAILLSKSFADRKYFNRQEVLEAFELFTEEKNDDTLLFWRLINLELWLRIFFDKEKRAEKKKVNQKITIAARMYERHLLKTALFAKGDDYIKKISNYVILNNEKLELQKKWFVTVSEKIIAIAQGRSYFIWEIKPGAWAKILSRFVKRTPSGIGLGSPWTMQLAINEVGLTKILFASLASLLTKPLGLEGMFYYIAGREVAAIDGPTEYSLYPSNVSAKLAPKDPQKVSEQIHQAIERKLKVKQKQNFLGVVIIDANDLGQNVLANSTELDNRLVEKIFTDNPMGQGKEQTPLALVSL